MIECYREGGLAILTLNRPDKANALTADMLSALIVGVAKNSDAHALILTGKGRAFSAGADLEEVRTGLATSPLWEELSQTIANHSGLTIAALNGTLAGGAFGMALACDLRLAVPDANFFYPVMKLGVLPQPSDPARLAVLIGPARSKLLLMAGEKWTSEEALQYGLIESICDDPLTRARHIADDTLSAETHHIAAIKSMI